MSHNRALDKKKSVVFRIILLQQYIDTNDYINYVLVNIDYWADNTVDDETSINSGINLMQYIVTKDSGTRIIMKTADARFVYLRINLKFTISL